MPIPDDLTFGVFDNAALERTVPQPILLMCQVQIRTTKIFASLIDGGSQICEDNSTTRYLVRSTTTGLNCCVKGDVPKPADVVQLLDYSARRINGKSEIVFVISKMAILRNVPDAFQGLQATLPYPYESAPAQLLQIISSPDNNKNDSSNLNTNNERPDFVSCQSSINDVSSGEGTAAQKYPPMTPFAIPQQNYDTNSGFKTFNKNGKNTYEVLPDSPKLDSPTDFKYEVLPPNQYPPLHQIHSKTSVDSKNYEKKEFASSKANSYDSSPPFPPSFKMQNDKVFNDPKYANLQNPESSSNNNSVHSEINKAYLPHESNSTIPDFQYSNSYNQYHHNNLNPQPHPYLNISPDLSHRSNLQPSSINPPTENPYAKQSQISPINNHQTHYSNQSLNPPYRTHTNQNQLLHEMNQPQNFHSNQNQTTQGLNSLHKSHMNQFQNSSVEGQCQMPQPPKVNYNSQIPPSPHYQYESTVHPPRTIETVVPPNQYPQSKHSQVTVQNQLPSNQNTPYQPSNHLSNLEFNDQQIEPKKSKVGEHHFNEFVSNNAQPDNENTPKSFKPSRNENTAPIRTEPYNRYPKAPIARKTEGQILEIASLNPFLGRWLVKGRFINKKEPKYYSNNKGEGKLLSIDLIDKSSSIRCTFFNRAVDKFNDIIRDNEIYLVSKGILRPTNRKFNNLPHNYEIQFSEDAIIQWVSEDDPNIPEKEKTPLSKISSIAEISKGTLISLYAVCISIADISDVLTRSTGQTRAKREITLVDDSGASIDLTLWGNKPSDPLLNIVNKSMENPVLFIENARVDEFNGKKISTNPLTTIKVNDNSEITKALRNWYSTEGKFIQFTFLTNLAWSMDVKTSEHITIAEINKKISSNTSEAEFEDKGYWFNCTAVLTHIDRTRPIFWIACPTCNKKVTQVAPNNENNSDSVPDTQTEDIFSNNLQPAYCSNCSKQVNKPVRRYLLNIEISDHSGSLKCTAIAAKGSQLMGNIEPDALVDIQFQSYTSTDVYQNYEDYFTQRLYKLYVFKIQAKSETYRDETKIKFRLFNVEPLNAIMPSDPPTGPNGITTCHTNFIKECNRMLIYLRNQLDET